MRWGCGTTLGSSFTGHRKLRQSLNLQATWDSFLIYIYIYIKKKEEYLTIWTHGLLPFDSILYSSSTVDVAIDHQRKLEEYNGTSNAIMYYLSNETLVFTFYVPNYQLMS